MTTGKNKHWIAKFLIVWLAGLQLLNTNYVVRPCGLTIFIISTACLHVLVIKGAFPVDYERRHSPLQIYFRNLLRIVLPSCRSIVLKAIYASFEVLCVYYYKTNELFYLFIIIY